MDTKNKPEIERTNEVIEKLKEEFRNAEVINRVRKGEEKASRNI